MTMMECNSKLEAARRSRGWTLAVASQKIGVHPRTLRRWETGKSKPQGFRVYKISEIYETTPTALGIGSDRHQLFYPGKMTTPIEQDQLLTHLAEPLLTSKDLDLHLMGLILQRKLDRQNLDYWTFQQQIDQCIKEYDDYTRAQQTCSPTDPTRQQALCVVASIPLAAYLENISPHALPAPPEDILTHCAGAITVCWHMGQGEDLALARAFISGYLLLLIEVFERAPHCRQATAELIAQACLLRTMLALQLDDPQVGVKSYARALAFSRIADTTEPAATPLIQPGMFYGYGRQSAQALRIMAESLWLLKPAEAHLELLSNRAQASLHLHDMDWTITALRTNIPQALNLGSEGEMVGTREAYHLIQFLLPDDSLANAAKLKDLLKTHD